MAKIWILNSQMQLDPISS